MIIRSRDFTYEVIRQMECGGSFRHYQCRCEQDNTEYHLVRMEPRQQTKQLLTRVLEMEENSAFTDLRECFTEQDTLVLVFPYPVGDSLAESLADRKWSLAERFFIGQRLLERTILLQMPDWLVLDILNPKVIFPEHEPLSLLYFGRQEQAESLPEGGRSGQALAALLEILFAAEWADEQFPEISEFLGRLNDGDLMDGDMLLLYQAYLELLPVCTIDRSAPVTEKESWQEKGKRLLKLLVTGFKLLMGASVLIAALVMIPGIWKNEVVPVVEAATLWKAVYVDGETLEAEVVETEPETEPVPDQDNGQVIRYWESGKVSYRGNMLDGLFDGKGTRYFSNGLMEYQGEYLFGKKDGEGCLYSPGGFVLYEGGFKRDRYEGQGKLYHEDSGKLIYEGGFSGGKYSGEGCLFDPVTEYPVYDGSLRQGYYDGYGVEYDSSGIRLYEGEFVLGIYHGHGIYYDTSTGEVMMEGEFRNGMLMIPKDWDLLEDSDLATPTDAEMRGGIGDEGTDSAMVVSEKG